MPIKDFKWLGEQHDVCVVVPAYNEERVIAGSLKALRQVVPKRHIYVVSDGSSDATALLAGKLVPHVLNLAKNVGKARALQSLIKHYHLFDQYKYILFADADSRLTPNFLKEVKKHMKSNPACIVGTVTSDRGGLISAYRTYEYGLTHRVFKRAQDIMKVITVAPGCASLYRSDVLSQLDFEGHTLTEDFDLTLQIHKKGLGAVVYAPKAKVVTQDPLTMRDYRKQVTRWYTGFWQNIFHHKLYKPNKAINLEVSLLLLDSVAWIGSVAFGFSHVALFLHLLLISYVVSVALAVGILLVEWKPWAFLYIPFFPIFQFVNMASYIISFFRAIRGGTRKLSWDKVARYALTD